MKYLTFILSLFIFSQCYAEDVNTVGIALPLYDVDSVSIYIDGYSYYLNEATKVSREVREYAVKITPAQFTDIGQWIKYIETYQAVKDYGTGLKSAVSSVRVSHYIQTKDYVKLRAELAGVIPVDKVEVLIGYIEKNVKPSIEYKTEFAVFHSNTDDYWCSLDKDLPTGDIVVYLSDLSIGWEKRYDPKILNHKGRIMMVLDYRIGQTYFNRIELAKFVIRYKGKFTAYVKGGGWANNRDWTPPFPTDAIEAVNMSGDIAKALDTTTPLGAICYFDNGWTDREWFNAIGRDADFVYMWGMGYPGVKDFISPGKHFKDISGGKPVFWGSLCGNGREQDIQKIREAGYLGVCSLPLL